MITGAHILLYSKNAEADRGFFRDVLGFHAVDAGGGWLIFALPPAELAVHPGSGEFVETHGDVEVLGSILYLMCDDLNATLSDLKAKKVAHTPLQTASWGTSTTLALPSGGHIGLYQPTHPTAANLESS